MWSELSSELFDLLTKKGVYPYSYIDSWEKLNEDKLPSIESFYDPLNLTGISNEQYNFAQTVWQKFNIKSLNEYTQLYLKTDVLLLADVFENFRNKSILLYELDPVHYISLPSYSWDCMLKLTNVQIKLLTDIDMVLFVEEALRGGICQCSLRHCVANNKYMKDFDKNQPSNYLMYFDVNNLYGWAMTQSLPINNFEWINENNFKNQVDIDILLRNTDDINGIYGYILAVDLSYPKELHDLHDSFPFCCQHMEVGESNAKKLVLTLHDKKNYVLHHRTLRMVLKHGLKLTKVHKILRFHQSKFIESYILLNNQERQKSKNDFEKNLCKLMNNACFGKFLEQVRNYSDIKLVTKWDGRYGAKTLIGRPTFKRSIIFNDNLSAIELLRTNIIMNKPFIIGVSILEISKLKMYDFHYEFMLSKFSPNDCRIVYSDTDSLIYQIFCDDVYTDFIKSNYNQFDTSDYEQHNAYGIQQQNKKVLGIMKDENNGRIMSEFIGLRSKMYTIKLDTGLVSKKAKGVKKSVLSTKITFDDFKKCVHQNCVYINKQSTIQSYLHKVYTISTNKRMLDANDDKRVILNDNISTRAIGNYKNSI